MLTALTQSRKSNSASTWGEYSEALFGIQNHGDSGTLGGAGRAGWAGFCCCTENRPPRTPRASERAPPAPLSTKRDNNVSQMIFMTRCLPFGLLLDPWAAPGPTQ